MALTINRWSNIIYLMQVRWFKDGSEIRKGKKYEIVAKGVQRILIVHKSMFDDEAEYECDARTSKTSALLTVIGEKNPYSLLLCISSFWGKSGENKSSQDVSSENAAEISPLPWVHINLFCCSAVFGSQRRQPGSPRTCPTWREQRRTA